MELSAGWKQVVSFAGNIVKAGQKNQDTSLAYELMSFTDVEWWNINQIDLRDESGTLVTRTNPSVRDLHQLN